MRLLLLRHGQSRANLEGIIQGDDDPLTDVGRAQADRLGAYLADRYRITHLYVSPLARARETGEIVAGHISLQPRFEPGLAEINAGTAAGLRWEEWRLLDPERADRWRWEVRHIDDQWEGGESGRSFSDRVFAAWDRIVADHLGTEDVVAVVSHGGALAWITARLYGDPMDYWPASRAGFLNCSVSELTIDAEGVHAFGPWNQTSHLEASTDDQGS